MKLRKKKNIPILRGFGVLGAAAVAAESNKKIADDDATEEGKKQMVGTDSATAWPEAAISVPRSTAARFAEWARASRATEEEAATEYERLCRAIVEDQAGALDAALGPTAAEQVYLAMFSP